MASTLPSTLTGLTSERVRRDVEVVARAGLDLETFLEESIASVQRAVPFVGACLATHDPGTLMVTSARKYGELRDRNAHDHEWGLIEYGSCEQTAYVEMVRAGLVAASVHAVTGGDVEQSERMRTLVLPNFGYADEARLVIRDGSQVWGGLAMFRGSDERPFDEREVEFLASLSQSFAHGVRSGLLTRLAEAPGLASPLGPAVVIVDSRDRVVQMSVGAEERLADLGRGSLAYGDHLSPVSALVGAARRYARGETDVVPRSRVRASSGMWLMMHASPLSASGAAVGSAGERQGDVVVTIEEARPPEIVALVVAAFGLTQRERDVTQLVLQGVDTKEIAATLHLSAYTVQDHLKSVFEKADVRSRRELISRVYFEQYVPRIGSELGPSGWFAGTADRPD
ncbi:response regulator transcription factor [Nocardioides sp. GCM10027113]|uniref:helix-turn-helix transcriptional regulator n=1 Tax=unclassified Nocardioides TaxID=2615069 RepID=UPI00361D7868